MMHASRLPRIGLALLCAGGLFVWFATRPLPSETAQPGKTFGLQPPAFVRQAYAAPELDIAAKLDEEAGISAYFRSPDAINLNQVRGVFRTIELETADYVLGSVAIPNYVERFDAHVYVHKTGWILAYYLRGDPVSKIIDARATTINTTKLKTAVASVASAAGAPFTDVAYYDFRYPNATNMMFIAEDLGNGNDFTVQLPSAYGYFDRGWALLNFSGDAYFTLNGARQNAIYWDGAGYGSLTASQLLPDITYTIAVDDWGVLVLVYRVP
jgi:hypothetical protein